MKLSQDAYPVFDKLTGSAYVLLLRTGKWRFFNPSAGKLLKQLADGVDLETALRNVAAGYRRPVDVDVLRIDMEPVLRAMIDLGILEENE
ncbi:MAG TPA: hypothetical protein VLA77_02040 [Candidatus Saccharimonadales bacterium]|nr:hypothetical protein [Candidatus Saccharimonadales bacterium]